MKKAWIGIAGLGAAGLITFAVWILVESLNVTRPYGIRHSSIMPAPPGAVAGYQIHPTAQMLSVFHSCDVVLVADPGVSFQYEELWLVPLPCNDQGGDLQAYQFQLPEDASERHINDLDANIPGDIMAVAQATAGKNTW